MNNQEILKEYIKTKVLNNLLESKEFKIILWMSFCLLIGAIIIINMLDNVNKLEHNMGITIVSIGLTSLLLHILNAILFNKKFKKIYNNLNDETWASINSLVESLNFSSVSITYKNGYDFKESYKEYLIEKIVNNKCLLKQKETNEYKEVSLDDLFKDYEGYNADFLINGQYGFKILKELELGLSKSQPKRI